MQIIEAIKKDVFTGYGSELIKHGHNHDVFLLEKDTQKYIGHVGTGVRDSGSSLCHANSALHFLESENITFVPKVVAYCPETDVMIQTCIGESDVVFEKLTKTQLDVFMKQLATVHSFTSDTVQSFCSKNNFVPLKIQTPAESLKTFGEDRFEIVKQGAVDTEVMEWIVPKLKESVVWSQSLRGHTIAGLRMGDIGGNIRTGKKDDDLFLIDWEFASLGYEHELAYIKIHSHPTDNQFRYMVERYAVYSGMSTGDLYAEIAANEKITRVNDVIWAAMKWGQNIKNPAEVKKYKELTYKRMKLYESKIE